ncbi:general substrate transporter [Rhizodiscina lignyota]|uniref:General substrate transporter n=1 Tax=Rhizodiscina lignyota TaxID=1504668 RepID=A0A9P4IF71_9PEZI|nr:general substrate transporter [Rhizodiscina lignyota]
MKHTLVVSLGKYPEVTWWKHKGLRKLYLMLPILFLAATTNGYDSSLLNGLQTLLPWQNYYNHPDGSRLGLMNAIYNLGGLSALPFSSYCADLWGRRVGVCIGVVLIFVGTVVQVVPSSNHYGMFVGGRFLVGLGSNISQGSAPVLVVELAHPQHRGRITTMYNAIYYIGAIVAAWTVFGTVKYTTDISWRIPNSLQVMMPGLQLLLVFLLPESPRWLCSKDRGDEALKVLVEYHAAGDTNDRFVISEFAEIQETIRLEKVNSKRGWQEFFKTPGNRKRLSLIALTAFFSQCSGNGLVSYYLHSILDTINITNSRTQAEINGCLTIWSFVVAFIACFFVDKVGRRPLFMSAGIGMLIAFSVWTGCSAVYAQTQNPGAGKAVVAMIFLFYGAAGLAWPGLTVAYSVEICPFNIRAKGIAVLYACKALASVFNQYVNPIGLKHLSWKFYFVYIAILVLECLIIWFFFVETKGPTLEEIARLFDGDKANVSGKQVLEGKGGAEHIEELE